MEQSVPDTTCLAFKHISKNFPGVKALTDVDAEIYTGEIHALMGANGAGKSTLIKILARVYEQSEGDILLNGESISKATAGTIRDYGIDFIFQELELVPGFSAAQNILIGIEPKKAGFVDWKKMQSEAQSAMDAFIPGVVDVSLPVNKLSVAKQQLVCIVRALYRNPKILILDEPTSRLSTSETDALFAAIEKIRKERGITIIYVSHRLEEIYRICDRVTILRDGVKVGTYNLKELDKQELVYKMVGRQIKSDSSRTRQTPASSGGAASQIPALKVEHISSENIVRDISFEVYPGEIFALTGAVGSRKTELIEAVLGIRRRTTGTIYINGKEQVIAGPHNAKELGICLIPEDRRKNGVIYDFSVKENATLAFIKRWRNPVGAINRHQEKSDVSQIVKDLSVKTASIETPVKNLSGGNQQKVVIAKWLLGDSYIYFFDEPTVGIDVKGKQEIYEIIIKLAAEGKAVIVASSDVDEALDISDRLAVMFEGNILAVMDSCDADREKITYLTMGGLDK